MDDVDLATLADRDLEERRDEDRERAGRYRRELRAARASDEVQQLALSLGGDL